MAFDSKRVLVTTAATALVSAQTDRDARRSIAVYNDSAVTVYLGGPDVDISQGYPLATATAIGIDLDGDEQVYARVASGTAVVRVMEQGL